MENNKKLIKIGVLRETLSTWERRVALTPNNCKKLIEKGIQIAFQHSKTRCYSDDEYLEAGAILQENLSDCNLILGVQEPEHDNLLPDTTYMFFSHMKKGLPKNLKLLDKIISKRIRLIDYECIKEVSEEKVNTKRLVSFGKIAGIAGAINILKGIGELLLSRNYATPFVFTKLSYMYVDVEEAKNNFKILGDYLKEKYLPEDFSPFIIGILGNGQVSQGVQDAFKCMDAFFLSPKELVDGNFEKRRDVIYVVVFSHEDIYRKIGEENEIFDKAEFTASPELYESNFFGRYFTYCHILINCLYWEQRFPRIIRKAQLQHAFSTHKVKLLGISDISCDLDGAIEVLKEYSSYRSPFTVYEPITEEYIMDIDKASREGVIYSGIPHLAASFPIDASEYFSNLLLPFLENIVLSKYPCSLDSSDLFPEIKNAVITSQGALTDLYRNTFKYVEESKKAYSLSCSNVQSDNQYFTTIKTKGHLFDSGFFNNLIIFLNQNSIKHKVNFLNIGESTENQSVFYFDAYGKEKESIFKLVQYIETASKELHLEFSLLKDNTR